MLNRIFAILLMLPLISFAGTDFDIQPQYFKTQKGSTIVFVKAKEVPMLEIKVAFRAGSAYDEELFGLSALTAELLNQGNAGETATQIAEQLADTGAQFHSTTTRDMAVFELKSLSDPKALTQAVTVFSKIISQPDFNSDAFAREKNQQLIAIEHAAESPAEIANQTFFKILYQEHPYAHPILGTKETVQSIQREDIEDFYNSLYVAENAIIVMVGAIDDTKAKNIAEQIIGSIPKGKAVKPLPKAQPLNETVDSVVPFPSSQTMIRLGELGITHQNPSYFPLVVGNYILGGGALVSQLAREVRENRGLTYGVYSRFLPLPAIGPFIISLSTENKQAEQAIQVTKATIKKFVEEGPSHQELKEAKQYLTGSFPLSLASNGSIADMLLKITFYQLPKNYLQTYIDKIEATSSNEIKLAFQNNISPDSLIQVMVGNQ